MDICIRCGEDKMGAYIETAKGYVCEECCTDEEVKRIDDMRDFLCGRNKEELENEN